MLGRTISHYRIVSQLGAGGMGVVYGAEDVRLGRPVALKFVHDDFARDRAAVERFQFEARAASALNHPGICTIYDIGEDAGRPFIVMELMKGQTLRDRLASGPLRLHQIVDIGIHVADALDAAHAQGIIHRDIKPANIFLTDRGQAKILDFGLAKLSPRQTGLSSASTAPAWPDQLTVTAVTMGTVAYMSPEQVAGEELDGRTDLFSLGVVLYESATGRRPFTGNTSAVVLAAILSRAPVAPVVLKPDLPLRLQVIINNSLEKDRELRYQTAADLRADLKRARRDLESGQSGVIRRNAGVPSAVIGAVEDATGGTLAPGSPAPVAVTGPEVPLPPVRASGSRRRRGLLLGAAAVTVIAAVSASVWLVQRPVRTPETAQAAATAPDRVVEQALAPQVRAADPPGPAAPGRSAAPGGSRIGVAPAQPPQRTQGPPALVPPVAQQAGREPILSQRLPEMTAQLPASPPSASTAIAPPPSPAQPKEAAPAPPPSAAPAERRDPAAAASPPVEDDEAAIRRVLATYVRAIENKDLSLFRSVKPSLSREEERRIAEGFNAVDSQRVTITILSIDRRGTEAFVRLQRRDDISAGGRRQTAEASQLMTLSRTTAGWVIVEIGR